MDATVGIWADAVYGVVRNDDREVPLVRKLAASLSNSEWLVRSPG